MPDFLQTKQTSFSSRLKNFFSDKKRSSIVIIMVLLLAIPLTVWLASNTQIFRPRAAAGPIEPVSGLDSCVVEEGKVSCASFPIRLTSPLGPPTQAASPSPHIEPGGECTADSQCSSGQKCFNYLTYPGTCRDENTVCAQVITTACHVIDNCNDQSCTGAFEPEECKEFPTPCHVPPGWVIKANPSPSPSPSPSASVSPSPAASSCPTTALSKTNTVNSSTSITYTYTYPAATKIMTVNFPAKAGVGYSMNGQTSQPGQPLSVNLGQGQSQIQFTMLPTVACSPFTVSFTMVNNCGTQMSDFVGPGSASAYGSACQGAQGKSPAKFLSEKLSPPEVYAQSSLPGTSFYKIAETEAGLTGAQQKPYTQHPTITEFAFSNSNPGTKQIWVEFIGADGISKKEHISVELVEPGPALASLDCSMDISKQNLKLLLKGSRLGAPGGKVTVNSKDAQVVTWTENQVSATYKPESGLETGASYKVLLTTKDGNIFPEVTCLVDTSVISLGARLYCRAPGQFDIGGVKAVIVDEAGNRVNEDVTIDSEGLIKDIKTRLQVDKHYSLAIKAPGSLRKTADFIAAYGTTIVKPRDDEAFILPMGDIAPVVLPDGKINTPDRSEIVRQWSLIGSGDNRTADFNRDSKVNSIDWACMRFDFNKADEAIPLKAGQSESCREICAPGHVCVNGSCVLSNPVPSPSPGSSPSSPAPSATSSPSPAASPSVSPSPSPQPSGPRQAYFLINPVGGGTYRNGDEFIVDVNLWSQKEPANLFVAKISFDAQTLEVVRMEKGTVLSTWAEEYFDNQGGHISLVAGRPSPGLQTTEGNDPRMMRIIFKAKNIGISEIKLTSESKIYSNVDNMNILSALQSAQIAITN